MTKSRKKPPARRKPPSRRRIRFKLTPKTKKIAVIVLAVLLLLLWYVLAARAAATGYQRRLGSGPLAFSGHITFQGQDFLSPLNTDLAFSGHYSGTNPLAADLDFAGNWGNRSYNGTAQMADSRLYFALTGPDMPVIRYRQGAFLLPLEAGREYTARADESLFDNICAHNQPASLQKQLELYRTIKELKLSPWPLVNFWSSVDGHPATHLSASLSGKQLAGLWSALQQAAPPGCGDPNTIGFTSDDLQHVSTHIDLYSGRTQDRVVITLNDKTLGAKAAFTLKTFNYGQPVIRPVPKNATDINAIYARLR